MGYMDGRMGNATPPTYWHQLHWWKSPRWLVIRIEVLTVVAIIISFSLAIFGSCRRWSNRWIVQKGFFAAQVLSLSLGTYSIGLMQSSSVKSEMYPIWTVSLFTLFGCIDPVTTYNGLDYKGPLSKVVYGICLNCGYVLFMSISTISNVVGKVAIITLSAITFIKSFHRSFAFLEQNKLCDMVKYSDYDGGTHIFTEDGRRHLITADDIDTARKKKLNWLPSSCDVWVALCLSHKLRCYFLGLDYHVPSPRSLQFVDLKWALKITEIELAFVYDALFTGNPFLHYYQAKTASLWALVSFAGICFVLVATDIPGEITRHSCATGCSKVVGTTTADLVITFSILVSLALLQLLQLVRSWTSNWAIAAVFCAYTGNHGENFPRVDSQSQVEWEQLKLSGWIRLKAFVATSTNMFDKYLWQDKIGQYSVLPKQRLLTRWQKKGDGIPSSSETKGESKSGRLPTAWWKRKDEQGHTKGERIRKTSLDLVHMLGLHYIWQVIWELLIGDTNKRGGIKLDEDVKGSVIDFLAQLQFVELDRNWLSCLPEEPWIRYFLPQFSVPRLPSPEDHCYRYMSCLMTWHIATWYCEQKCKEEDALMSKQTEAPICLDEQTRGEEGTKTRDHRHVANALSQYCVYLVKSAPELLPGPVGWSKRVYNRFARDAKVMSDGGNMSDRIVYNEWNAQEMDYYYKADSRISNCKALAKLVMHGRSSDELWKTLALVWVQLLVYAAPYGKVEAHMRHLSQGGEFITHLWAMLYHLDIREWKVLEVNNLHDVSTVDDAQRILNDDDLGFVVVFFKESLLLKLYREEIVAVSKLVDGVKFHLTSSRDVAKCLYFPEYIDWTKDNILVFLKKADKTITFYDPVAHGWYKPWDLAHFVYDENKLASAQARAQKTAPSTRVPVTFRSPSRSRSEDGQTVVEIQEETPPPF